MDRQRLFDLGNDPNMIPGIYNYCDSWCERCTHTLRCATYAMREGEGGGHENTGDANQAIWKRITETLRSTIEILTDMADEEGIDLDTIDDETMREMHAEEEAAKAHPLSQASEKYALEVHEWFEGAGELFERKARGFQQEAELDLPGSQPEDDFADLQDAVEIIDWYHLQIHVKLLRAVKGQMQELPAVIRDMPKDSDGSAKVALLGIDRSLAAWGRLLGYFPDQERQILDFLTQLDRLRRAAEKEFPRARAFVRPGFDD